MTKKEKRIYLKQWRKDNPNYMKQWYEDNPDYYKKYCQNYPEKVRLIWRKMAKRRYKKNRVSKSISSNIYQSVQSNKTGRHWETLVGYTLPQLKQHLEKQFLVGMSWDNYGQWHIDHIIPISAFNFKTPKDIDFKRCWALNNLQPLWAKDNSKKRAKLNNPFQLALLIGERQNKWQEEDCLTPHFGTTR